MELWLVFKSFFSSSTQNGWKKPDIPHLLSSRKTAGDKFIIHHEDEENETGSMELKENFCLFTFVEMATLATRKKELSTKESGVMF